MPTPRKSERSVRSKSPGRTKSKSRSRSRSRGRSRARSRSPARTKQQKQATTPSPTRKSPSRKSPARKAKQTPAEKPKQTPEDAGTPTRRQSARIAQKMEEKEKPDMGSGDKNDQVAKTEVKAVKGKKFPFEFGGPVVAFLMTLGLPAFVIYLNLACTKSSCDVRKVPTIPRDLKSYFDLQAAGIFIGHLVFQALLAVAPFGKVVQGLPVKSGNNKRLNYRCNGLISLALSIGLMVGLVYMKYPVTVLYTKFLQLATTSIVFSYLLSICLYVKARNAPASSLSDGGKSGCVSYDFFMGRELNPRVGPLDLKFFCELRPGLIGWVMLNLAFAIQAHQTGNYCPALGMVIFFQFFYVADGLFFEPAILSTMDITNEGFGAMLAFGDLSWVPFTYSLQARYLLEHPQKWPVWALVGFGLLWLVGYMIFRGSNSQKDQFRKNPHDPALAHLETIPGGQGKKLLVSGWWGLCRHPNYLGDLILAMSWSLPCGFASVFPYFYPVYFLLLLVHRGMRDDAACRKKHGAAWDRYCERVPYRIIPKVY